MYLRLCIYIYEAFEVVEKSVTILGKARISSGIGIGIVIGSSLFFSDFPFKKS